MVDDMGFSDIGCYGGEVITPNIDKLAEKGLRFTQFYNAGRCCPTRASLLTGLYSHQAGIGHMVSDLGYEGYRGDLGENTVTIAEVLKMAGYQTMMVGKWHVTKYYKEGQLDHNWPLQRGFDHYYGTLPGAGSFWNPYGLMENNEFITPEGDYYYTEAITQHAKDYILQASSEKPFFLYVAYTAPHYPLHARQEVIRKYKGRFAQGWDSLRRKRYKRLVEKGIIDSNWPLSPRDEESIPWQEVEHKEWQQNRMEVYAAMIDHVDQGMGEIVTALRNKNELNNTMIMFLSDNGGSSEGHLYGKIERLGIPWKSPMIPNETKDGVPVNAGDHPGLPLGPDSTFGSYGARWANVSNTPFRRFKSWVHEGGIATPFIAFWPNGIQQQNKFRTQISHVIDIMPTCLELAGIEYPTQFKGKDILPVEGRSIIPIFENKELEERRLFWEHEGNRAVRKGRWKLVSEFPGDWKSLRSYPNDGEWELYDMEVDRTELNNLANEHPEIVKQLAVEWEEWAEQSNVMPWSQISQ